MKLIWAEKKCFLTKLKCIDRPIEHRGPANIFFYEDLLLVIHHLPMQYPPTIGNSGSGMNRAPK